MIPTLLRGTTCILTCLLLFIACNQTRHITSRHTSAEEGDRITSKNTKIEKLFTVANSLIGKPYRSGSRGPKSFDCSGFTSHVFHSIELTLPRSAQQQSRIGDPVKLMMVRPGDLLFFGNRYIDHVALVTKVKSNKYYIIHSTTGHGVMKEVLQDSDYWMKRFKIARRVII